MNQLFDTLQQFKIIFLPHVEDFFINHREYTNPIDPLVNDIIEKLYEFTLRGGKCIRPALLYYGYQCFSDENLFELLKTGIVCELMQSFLLIHDDIMDDAELRRGGKTIHKIYSVQDNHGHHYGISMGILLGNIAGYLGLKAIASLNFPVAKKYKIMELYSQICIDVGYGQALDMYFQPHYSYSENDIYNIYRYKTARYTTEFPLISAALLAEESVDSINKIIEIGNKLGIIFQIQDDILGLFGDPEKNGKSTLSDVAQGKKTLLIHKAWQSSNPAQKAYLTQVYGNHAATFEQVLGVREIMRDTKALFYAQENIKNFASDILKILNNMKIRTNGKNFILNLLDYYTAYGLS